MHSFDASPNSARMCHRSFMMVRSPGPQSTNPVTGEKSRLGLSKNIETTHPINMETPRKHTVLLFSWIIRRICLYLISFIHDIQEINRIIRSSTFFLDLHDQIFVAARVSVIIIRIHEQVLGQHLRLDFSMALDTARKTLPDWSLYPLVMSKYLLNMAIYSGITH